MSIELTVSGLGVVSAIGQGKTNFLNALLEGAHAFRVMRRAGRQRSSAYLGAEVDNIISPVSFSPQLVRAASYSTLLGLVVLQEAWDEARLSDVDPARIGLIVGGSNFQQREIVNLHDNYREKSEYLRPTYALSHMDTDMCGFCTAQFDIRGPAFTVGGASASGQLALVQAANAVRSGALDVCIALGAMADLSYWECQSFRAIGAMGSDRYANEPALASRPFDRDRDGFIFGECSGAVVVESTESARHRGLTTYGLLSGWGMSMDGNRNPDPSLDGEVKAVQSALRSAEVPASEVDYVNPHGTGSPIGDETELLALRACELEHSYLNATKSLTGHGLCAGGIVEVIATLLQMRNGRLHPNRNLQNPIDRSFNWVGDTAIDHQIEIALTLSMGFGGMNTALCWRR